MGKIQTVFQGKQKAKVAGNDIEGYFICETTSPYRSKPFGATNPNENEITETLDQWWGSPGDRK